MDIAVSLVQAYLQRTYSGATLRRPDTSRIPQRTTFRAIGLGSQIGAASPAFRTWR